VETDQRADKEAVAAAIERVGDVRAIKASEVFGRIKQQMESLFFIMLGGGLLAALAAIVQIFARFSSLPWDRKGEWGLYRALGATRDDLKRLILGEAAILTGAGVAIGLLLGGVLGLLAHAWLQGQRAFPFIEASWSKTALAIVVTAAAFGLVALVAAWWPARQSGRIAPSSAMAMGDID
jgi:putative ABC transport system permease protein